MDRKLYICFVGMLAVAGGALAMHLLRMQDPIPAVLEMHSRYGIYNVTRHYLEHSILLDAFLLPIVCAIFAFVAHLGRETDIISWVFVGGFYVAFWYLAWEADHAFLATVPNPREISVTYPVSSPVGLLLFAIAAGLGFWKWKQD
jgi:hypothetical protein